MRLRLDLTRIMPLLFSGTLLTLLISPVHAAPISPFADAVAVWHMADEHDRSTPDSALKAHGAVTLNQPLPAPERAESLRRGGDGRIAELQGGWLAAGQGAAGELNITGTALTLCARLRDPSGNWSGPLFSKHGGHGRLSYNLFATTLHGTLSIGFELGTDFKSSPLQLSFPVERLDRTAWHDVVVRYSGARLELFIDGVLVDEEWPAGKLRVATTIPCLLGAEAGADEQTHARSRLLLDHAALWNRALSDEEVVFLSGGKETVQHSTMALLGAENPAVRAFWKPPGNASVGDCMPFYDGKRWHLYYLVDRRAHRSKWGLGAHQWAHASTTNLIHWEHHPLAVPITEAGEGSICTGSVILRDGEYRAYYAVRTIDGTPAPLRFATSGDGIQFTKTDWGQTLTPPYTGASARDPHVFQNPKDGTFIMLVTTSLMGQTGAARGCLAQLVSRDLKTWEERPPFFVPGLGGEPECAEWFEWNGWYYLVFSNGGIARYRMARNPTGPWMTPKVAAFDGSQCAVMKSAPFHGGRRIGAAFLPRPGGGYAGNVVFREMVQQPDGTLTTRFAPELMPRTGTPARLQATGPHSEAALTGSGTTIRSAGSRSAMEFDGLPRHFHLKVRVQTQPGTSSFGIGLHDSLSSEAGSELRFLPDQRQIEIAGGATLPDVDGLVKPLDLELFVQNDMLDLCVDGRRTFSSRVRRNEKNALSLFVERGEIHVEDLVVKPLTGI